MATGYVDCDTELCLTPGGRGSGCAIKRPERSVTVAAVAGEQQKKISVFCGDRVCICDVTEIQARAIICMARREMEEVMRSRGWASRPEAEAPAPAPALVSTEPQLLNPGMSMKRSLQRFLQKRKSRVCGMSSPYQLHNHQNLQSDSSSSS